jgi:hypothetical protein
MNRRQQRAQRRQGGARYPWIAIPLRYPRPHRRVFAQRSAAGAVRFLLLKFPFHWPEGVIEEEEAEEPFDGLRI